MFETSSTFGVLARAMDVCALRQAVYSANIANANVQGYRRLEVMFDAQAMRAEAANNKGSIFGAVNSSDSATQPQVIADTNTTVQLDQEMATMARNALRYQSLQGAYERSISLLQLAVHEGRGS